MFSVFFLENADLFINYRGARGEAPQYSPPGNPAKQYFRFDQRFP